MEDISDSDVWPLILPAPGYELARGDFLNHSEFRWPRQDPAPFLPPPIMTSQVTDFQMPSDFDINLRPPFLNPAESIGLQAYSVLRLSNIPYSVTISEIKHLIKGISEHALIEDHQQGFAVHIVMERSTGKTMECYVELQYQGAAEDLVSKAQLRYSRGKAVKIGSRHINFAVSSEGALIAALFPRAKNCFWNPVTGTPELHANIDPYSEGFQGFFTIEEMASMIKLAEVPQRSQFSNRSHQRPYESMISILYKFPWSSTQYYTVNARNLLFTAYAHLLRLLVQKVPPMTDPSNASHMHPHAERQVGINHALLMDFLFAGLNTPCFSLRQKCFIVSNCGPIGLGFPLEFHAAEWPFQALSPPPKFPDHLLTTWLRVFKIGYHAMKSTNDNHGFEDFMDLSYDDGGYPIFELTDIGRSLHFGDLVAVETSLMEKIVDKGRAKWCFDNCVPYAPMKSYEPHSYGHAVHPPQQAAKPTGPGKSVNIADYRGYDPALEHNQRPMVPLPPAQTFVHSSRLVEQTLPAPQYREMRNNYYAAVGTYGAVLPGNEQLSQLRDRKTYTKVPGSHGFNPATPPFIPSQPWSATTQNTSQHAPTNAPKAPCSHSLENVSSPYNQTSLSTTARSAMATDSSRKVAPVGEDCSANDGPPSWAAGSATSGGNSSTGKRHTPDALTNGPRWSTDLVASSNPRSSSNDPTCAPSSTARETSNARTASRSRGSSAVRFNTLIGNLTIHEESGADLDESPKEETGGIRLAKE